MLLSMGAALVSIAIWMVVFGLSIAPLFGESALTRWLVWILIVCSPLCLFLLLYRHFPSPDK